MVWNVEGCLVLGGWSISEILVSFNVEKHQSKASHKEDKND